MIEEPKQLTLRAKFPRPTAAQIAAFKDVPTGFVCDAMGSVGGMGTAMEAKLKTGYSAQSRIVEMQTDGRAVSED